MAAAPVYTGIGGVPDAVELALDPEPPAPLEEPAPDEAPADPEAAFEAGDDPVAEVAKEPTPLPEAPLVPAAVVLA